MRLSSGDMTMVTRLGTINAGGCMMVVVQLTPLINHSGQLETKTLPERRCGLDKDILLL